MINKNMANSRLIVPCHNLTRLELNQVLIPICSEAESERNLTIYFVDN